MAEIIGGGEPVNDAERATIRQLRDHGPADWVVLHNIDLRLRDNRTYEIDLIVRDRVCVMTLIDVKGTRGRIEVAGGRWYLVQTGTLPLPGGEAARLTPGRSRESDTTRPEPGFRGRAGCVDSPGRPADRPQHR